MPESDAGPNAIPLEVRKLTGECADIEGSL